MEGRQRVISRRTLMKAAAVVPFAAVRGTAANSAVKVGLLGAGGRGSRVSSFVVMDKRARLVALCDLFDEQIVKAKQRIPVENPTVYKDLNEMLASDIDAVIIATPVFLHPEHFEAAVKAGKHIYIEKPAGVDVAGCKRVMKAADSAKPGLNISFGFQQRYGTTYRRAKAILDSRSFGPIHMAQAHFLKGPITGEEPMKPKPRTEIEKIKNWKDWRELYGDVIVETYSHSIDALNWFLGDKHPSKAHGSGGRTILKAGDMMDHCTVVFDYDKSVQATLIGTQIAPPFFREVFERIYGANEVIEMAREYWKHYRTKDDVLHELAPRPIDQDSVEAFITRVVEGKTENVGVRGAESTLTAIMGRMAIDKRREVTWEEMMKSSA